MGILSSSVSITRYHVDGKIKKNTLNTVIEGLKKNTIQEIDNEPLEKVSGWTSFDSPYMPDFETHSCIIGSSIVFSLRIDKKSIPSKVIKKYYTLEVAKKLAETGREHLSRNEKKSIKENVTQMLNHRIPATPNIYDVIWHYEASELWFLSNLKAANEELETLFVKSFNLHLIRLFPYTMADLKADLSDKEKDIMTKLSSTSFTE